MTYLKNNMNNTHIRYNKIFEVCEVEINYPKKKLIVRNNIKKLLHAFTDYKVIKGYTEYKEGKTIVGVKITLIKQNTDN